MLLIEYLCDKYILFRNSKGNDIYWKESALGYTDNIDEAGVFTGKDTFRYNVKVLQYHEVKSGKHRQYTHYAMTVKDAIQLLK